MPSTNDTKTFVVAGGVKGKGAGLGSLVAKRLLSTGVEVRVIARSGSAKSGGAEELAKEGAKIIEVDYANPTSLSKALEGVDVVLSYLNGDGLGQPQQALAKASKAANVKLFVPSEYGVNTLNAPSNSPVHGKAVLQALLKEIQLPYALVFTGGFADWTKNILAPKDNKVTITGDGKAPISFTGLQDVARWVSHVTTTVPLRDLSNKVLPIEGSRHNWNEIIAFYNKSSNTSLEVTHEPFEDALKVWEATHDFGAFLKAKWANGEGLVESNSTPAGNKLWKEWNPKDLSAFF